MEYFGLKLGRQDLGNRAAHPYQQQQQQQFICIPIYIDGIAQKRK